MKLTINGEHHEFQPQELTVSDLLGELGLRGRPVAVEVNHRLVFKREHESAKLQDGDRVEVVTMVGGG